MKKIISATSALSAVKLLQRLVTSRGKNFKTDYGAGNLIIAHDRCELTDQSCKVVARGPAKVVTVLRRKRRKA